MPQEQVCWSDEYRFAFNGMESDDEVHGSAGTSYDFGARMYDPRVGRWLSVDPLAGIYPEYSPYAFAGNNPVQFKDLDGEGFNGGFSVTNQSTKPVTIVGNALTVTKGFLDDKEVTSDNVYITLEPGQRFEAYTIENRDKDGNLVSTKYTGRIVQFAELDSKTGELVKLSEEKTVVKDAGAWDIDYLLVEKDDTFVDGTGKRWSDGSGFLPKADGLQGFATDSKGNSGAANIKLSPPLRDGFWESIGTDPSPEDANIGGAIITDGEVYGTREIKTKGNAHDPTITYNVE